MSEVKVDTISERTTDAGVTVEGVKIEDGIATFQTAAGSPLVFEGATADAFETTFAITDPTADRTITFPDASITLAAGGDNTPSFGAYRTANFDYTDDTWTKIPMDTEEWDSDSAFDHATNYRFTVPAGEAGKYFFSMTTTMTDTTGSGQMMGTIRTAIYKGADGGSSSAFKQSWFDGAGARHRWRCSTLSCVVDLIALDFIEFYGYGESDLANAQSLGGQSMTFCSGFKLL
jgi:hypothetical protein